MKNYKDTVDNYNYLEKRVKEVCAYTLEFFTVKNKDLWEQYDKNKDWDPWFDFKHLNGDLPCATIDKYDHIIPCDDYVLVRTYNTSMYKSEPIISGYSQFRIDLKHIKSQKALELACESRLKDCIKNIETWKKPKVQQYY